MTKKEFVSLLGEQARADMTKTGILASLTTAQGILESGYGTRELAVNANNIFGIVLVCSASVILTSQAT